MRRGLHPSPQVQLRPEGRGAEQEGRNPAGFSNPGSRKPLPRGLGEALKGPRRGVSVFKGVGQEGGPFRGP